ncbi:MAG TPA: class I SAM-dependent methyltransferase [Anaerolineaceae bacterium]|nr:class I SAM-dependent methyltransferase [Anaerolineaceae bacterium]
MEKAVQENLALWNEWTHIHEKSKMYNIEGFLAGENRLHSIELDELGAQVPGRSMLHLQCHFGLDSLSWARLGAQVTGADFSGEAIRLAKALNEKAGLSARFVCSELDKLPGVLEGQFDIVYTSYGVLTWLPDLTRWAQVIDHFLKPGGTFYMVEFHPYFMTLDDADNAQGVKIGYTYFHTKEPLESEVVGSYADRTAEVQQKVCYEWSYGVGDVLNNLLGVGLQLEYFHEFPYSVDGLLKSMVKDDQGYYRLKGLEEWIPLMFSLKANKPR